MSNEISVRPATRRDLPGVVSLFLEVLRQIPYYNELTKRDEPGKYTLEKLRARLRDDGYSVTVAEDESGLLGFAFTRFDDHVIWIEWFGVSPGSRRHGVGSAILQELVRTAPARSSHKVWCDSRTTNEPVRATFRRNGFREVARLENHWYGQDFILWERLAGAAVKTTQKRLTANRP